MITIIRRPLFISEIQTLMSELSDMPGLVYIDPSIWKSFQNPYVVLIEKQFAGVCQVYELGRWIKIGPIALLKKHQGHGIGKQLVARVMRDYPLKQIFLTTTNSALKKIAIMNKFRRIRSFFLLPIPIALFLIRQFFEYLRVQSIREYMKKIRDKNRGTMCFYIRS